MNGAHEQKLVELAQNGDADAFAELYRHHKSRIYALCLRMTANAADAEDLTQETFLQIHRKLKTYKGDSQLSTWLYRLAVNTVLMSFRKKNLFTASIDASAEPDSGKRDLRETLGARDPLLHFSIERCMLDRAIADLPPGYRTIFVLHHVEGYEHSEIAEILGCSIGNSKSQLHKARLRLFGMLRPAASFPEFERILNETTTLPVT